MKKRTVLAAALAAMVALGGCVSTRPAENPEPKEEAKPVVLVVSFGTSYNDSRDKTIGAIETAIAEANPDYEVRRAFQSDNNRQAQGARRS